MNERPLTPGEDKAWREEAAKESGYVEYEYRDIRRLFATIDRVTAQLDEATIRAEKAEKQLAEEQLQRTLMSSHEVYRLRNQAFEEAALEVEKHLRYPSIKLNGGDSDTDGRIVRPIAKAIRKLKAP